ncbi:MAG: 4Fe-4S binding protein [Flexilinea sp.]
MEMIVNHKQCDGCGLCVGICPYGGIQWNQII